MLFHKLWFAVMYCDWLILPLVDFRDDILIFFLLLHCYFITFIKQNEFNQTNLQNPHLRREKNY